MEFDFVNKEDYKWFVGSLIFYINMWFDLVYVISVFSCFMINLF